MKRSQQKSRQTIRYQNCESGTYRPNQLRRTQSDIIERAEPARIGQNRNTVDVEIIEPPPITNETVADRIARNERIIEKLSPIIKYKIQEFLRKNRAKAAQRRKFSLAKGLPDRLKAPKAVAASVPEISPTQRNISKNLDKPSTSSSTSTINREPTDYSLLDNIELD